MQMPSKPKTEAQRRAQTAKAVAASKAKRDAVKAAKQKGKAKAAAESSAHQKREQTHAPARDYGAAGPPFDADRRRRYLEALIETGGRQKAAAKEAGLSYTTVYERRKVDPAFQRDEDEAMAAAMVTIEDEARRRAIQGCQRTFFSKDGQISRIETEYSDTILLRLLERMETGQWRQRQQVETGAPGAFKTMADLEAAIAKRQADLAKARAEMAAESEEEYKPADKP